ncbi:MAG: hypothetical protein CM15mV150_020 [Caudoviricetes sp.]|nr:MAG: hypothetical protein CM15mV150_020 [Caudoviricetes sp.]
MFQNKQQFLKLIMMRGSATNLTYDTGEDLQLSTGFQTLANGVVQITIKVFSGTMPYSIHKHSICKTFYTSIQYYAFKNL